MNKTLTYKILFSFIFSILFIFSSCEKDVYISPPDIPPPNGKIFINSNPQGASIFRDGKDMLRVTPDSLTWLDEGEYKITLKKDNFLDTSFSAVAEVDNKTSYFIDYSKNPAMLGELYITSVPDGATIFLNDNSTGRITPAKITGLLPGNYSIKLQKQNFTEVTSEAVVRSSMQTNESFALIDLTKWQLFPLDQFDYDLSQITALAVDKNGILWIGTYENGLYKYDSKIVEHYLSDNSDLPNNSIRILYVDDNNMLWIGCPYGLAYFSNGLFFRYNEKTIPLPDYNIESIYVGESGRWFGTHVGLVRMYYDVDLGMVNEVITTSNSTLPNNIVTSLETDGEGNIWAGTISGGIAKFSRIIKNPGELPSYEITSVFTDKNTGLPSNLISCSAADQDGSVWFGHTPSGIKPGGISQVNNDVWYLPFNGIQGRDVKTLFVDSNNRKWLATSSGITSFINYSELSGGNTYYNKSNTGVTLSGVTSFAESSNGYIWMGTENDGLILLKEPGYKP